MGKVYTIQLVGEQHYQPAIGRCRVGDEIEICIEVGNPHDQRAIVALNRGERIGYLAKDSFVQRVIHDDGESIEAAIADVRQGERGFLEVSLDVSVIDEPAEIVRYSAAAATPQPSDSTVSLNDDRPWYERLSGLQMILGFIIVVALARCVF